MEYYLALKKNEILPFATTWVDLEGVTLNDMSQTDKDKYPVISLICEIIWYLSFSVWLISLSIIPSRSIHVVANGKISFFASGRVIFDRIYVAPLLYPFLYLSVIHI